VDPRIDAELIKRVDALRRPLELAAENNFRGVKTIAGLGHALRAALDGILSRLDPASPLNAWKDTLAKWETLGEDQQAIEVARGMRFCARFPRPVAPVSRANAPGLRAESIPRRAEAASRAPAAASIPVAPRVSTGASLPAGLTIIDAPAPPAKPLVAHQRSAALQEDATRQHADFQSAGLPAKNPASSRKPGAARIDPPLVGETPSHDAAPSEVTASGSGPTKGAAKKRAKPKGTDAPTIAGSSSESLADARSARNATTSADAATEVIAEPAIAAKPNVPKKKRAAAAAEPEEPIDPLGAPTNSLPGIGPAFAEKLAQKGLFTVEDLLWMVPRRYDDVRDAKQLAEVVGLPEGTRATFVAVVASSRMIFARGRRWGEVRLGAIDLTQPATALVRWFNIFAGIDKRMPPGARVTLSGVVKLRGGRLELANPDILGIEIDDGAKKPPPAILARYPDVHGVPPGRLRAACAAACARVAEHVDDGVPASVEREAKLPSLGETLRVLHSPPPEIEPEHLAALNAGKSEWQKRLAFGELFALGVAITLRRRERREDAAVPCVPLDAKKGKKPASIHDVVGGAFGFALTGAQRRSIDEICSDVGAAVPMNRLLQGDVGAGKTAVAFAAAVQVVRAQRQVAVMAPTELLAEQHFETWKRWNDKLGQKLRVEILTASTQKGVRASLIALLGAGHVDILIGTHSLLAEAVGFQSLGLVIIDEQHRFGVAQRARLRDKGDGQGAPHLLVMTATPIPRTLALTAYGDLDVSVLDEMPPGRQPVTTKRGAGARGAQAAWKLIAERVAAGERAYVVCPKVEPTDGDMDDPRAKEWADATSTADELASVLPNCKVGLVHGRLDAVQRDRVMRAFKQGEIDVLVATTVIEVGVDVPAATVMVVLDADRFGLAQLHQLRGRVGRGGGGSHCVLVAQGTLGPDAESRLDTMVETTDGFRIAEADLALRGPGELLGPRQAGVPRLRFGDLQEHTALLLEARRCAEHVLDGDPKLEKAEHASLRRAIDRRFAQHIYGAESG
jgi:ATP-dependent DNA helicase RecG